MPQANRKRNIKQTRGYPTLVAPSATGLGISAPWADEAYAIEKRVASSRASSPVQPRFGRPGDRYGSAPGLSALTTLNQFQANMRRRIVQNLWRGFGFLWNSRENPALISRPAPRSYPRNEPRRNKFLGRRSGFAAAKHRAAAADSRPDRTRDHAVVCLQSHEKDCPEK
jgi:hypothetical protein